MPLWGKTDDANDAPLYLSDADQENAIFIDDAEAANSENQAKGVNGPGWYIYNNYTDANGNDRHKIEKLVCISDADPVVTGDRDADDTTIGADTDDTSPE